MSGIKSDLPEPDDGGVIWVVAIFIFRVFSPVVDVHVSQATHQQLRNTDRSVRVQRAQMNKVSRAGRLTSSSFSSKILIRSRGISS